MVGVGWMSNTIILLIKMKIGQQAKPRLQIIKNINKHNYRTQENSPI